MTLENSFVKLRALEKKDIDVLYKWENDIEIWKVSNTLVPYSKYILHKYLECSHLDIYEAKQLRLLIETKEHKAVGTIELFDFDPFHERVGIGVLIADKTDRRKKYAFHALKILLNYTFKILQLRQVYCNIATDNMASLDLFKKLEFEIIGEKKAWLKTDFKSWKNEYMLQILNENFK